MHSFYSPRSFYAIFVRGVLFQLLFLFEKRKQMIFLCSSRSPKFNASVNPKFNASWVKVYWCSERQKYGWKLLEKIRKPTSDRLCLMHSFKIIQFPQYDRRSLLYSTIVSTTFAWYVFVFSATFGQIFLLLLQLRLQRILFTIRHISFEILEFFFFNYAFVSLSTFSARL